MLRSFTRKESNQRKHAQGVLPLGYPRFSIALPRTCLVQASYQSCGVTYMKCLCGKLAALPFLSRNSLYCNNATQQASAALGGAINKIPGFQRCVHLWLFSLVRFFDNSKK